MHLTAAQPSSLPISLTVGIDVVCELVKLMGMASVWGYSYLPMGPGNPYISRSQLLIRMAGIVFLCFHFWMGLNSIRTVTLCLCVVHPVCDDGLGVIIQ